jgi:hypothetical protein
MDEQSDFCFSDFIFSGISARCLRANSRVVWNGIDLLRRAVATLVNEEQPPGQHQVTFNAAPYPSGVYFYEMKIGNFRAVKKMTVLR